MEHIELPRGIWHYDVNAPLGAPGGFGEVFSGRDNHGAIIAVKRIYNNIGAEARREMEIVDRLIGTNNRHVIPYLDAGIDSGTGQIFIVMPRAETNLRSILEVKGSIPENEVIDILMQIANGLKEVADIVNRDLKPENILLLNGRWHITDFGIARICEAATAPNTLKGAMTPPYAAPEIWNDERATNATDIYALGCIGVELVSGRPPFVGKAIEDYASAHRSTPPTVSYGSDAFRALLLSMLAKNPNGRPSIDRVLSQLAVIHSKSAGPAASKLAAVAANLAMKQSEAEAAAAAAAQEKAARDALAQDGKNAFTRLQQQLFERISQAAPNAVIGKQPFKSTATEVILGDATLTLAIKGYTDFDFDQFEKINWKVVSAASIEIKTEKYSRSSSLWYADVGTGEYRWIEAAYFPHPLMGHRPSRYYPTHLPPLDAAMAHSTVMATWEPAMKPRPIDCEDFDEFAERWMARLADGASGVLRAPNSLPES